VEPFRLEENLEDHFPRFVAMDFCQAFHLERCGVIWCIVLPANLSRQIFNLFYSSGPLTLLGLRQRTPPQKSVVASYFLLGLSFSQQFFRLSTVHKQVLSLQLSAKMT